MASASVPRSITHFFVVAPRKLLAGWLASLCLEQHGNESSQIRSLIPAAAYVAPLSTYAQKAKDVHYTWVVARGGESSQAMTVAGHVRTAGQNVVFLFEDSLRLLLRSKPPAPPSRLSMSEGKLINLLVSAALAARPRESCCYGRDG